VDGIKKNYHDAMASSGIVGSAEENYLGIIMPLKGLLRPQID